MDKTPVVFHFRRMYDPVKAVPSPVGEVIEKEYRLIRDSSGNCSYVEVGEKNVSDYIQSFSSGCSLKAILDRCQLMPVRDKIAYLQQTESGLSADLTHMPKDGTEAYILISKLKNVCPDFATRLRNGESFEKILSDYVQPSDADPVSTSVQTNESEVSV